MAHKPEPLADATSIEHLTKLLNEQEEEGMDRQVLKIFVESTGGPKPKRFNSVEWVTCEDKLRPLKALKVPPGASVADAEKASTPEAKKAVKDVFLKFIAPELEAAEAVCRSEVYVNNEKIEIVLLRDAEPYEPASLNGVVLRGDAGWEWLVAEVVGDDIVVHGSNSTTFGGGDDQSDDGQTACGYSTKGHPDLKACSLALGGYAKSERDLKALGGTPLPKLPFGLKANGKEQPDGAWVEVFDPNNPEKKFRYPVIDLGPAKWTKHALDLTVAAARDFNPSATANNFSMVLDYRIIGGAKGLTAAQKQPAPVIVSNAAPTGINKKIYDSAVKNCRTLSTAHAPDTNNGNLACAWAVNKVVELALGHPIGGTVSTAEMYKALKEKGRGKEVQEGQATPGSIIISPTVGKNVGHVGILGERGTIYSNSSRDKEFEDKFNVTSWKAYYSQKKGLGVFFFEVVS